MTGQLRRRRFRTLLVSLVVLSVTGPLIRSDYFGTGFFGGMMTLVMLTVLVDLIRDQAGLRIGIYFAAPAVAARLVDLIWPGLLPEIVSQLFGQALMGFCLWVVYSSVIAPGRVDQDRIFGAVAVFLLLGYFFASVFHTVDQFAPGALRVPEGEVMAADGGLPMHTLVYFSFVTLTTLGFGEITPVSGGMRTAVWLEAVVGQLFLAVTLARLVALSLVHEGADISD